MKYLFLFLSLLVSGGEILSECNTQPEFIYELPDGFEVTHTLEENGLLTILDEFENGANIYVESDVIPIEGNPFDDYNLEMYEEVKFKDGGYLARFNNHDLVDPFDSAFYFRKNEIAIYAFLYKDGASETHSVFEEKTMQLARKIAQGENDEKTWKNCLCNAIHSYADCYIGESRSVDVPSLQVR